MSAVAPTAPDSGVLVFRSARRASFVAFWALLLRDLRVLEKGIGVFAIRTVMQPLLLVFVFTYVFPKIGQGIGGSSSSEAAFSTLLMAGVIATSMIFQGVQALIAGLVVFPLAAFIPATPVHLHVHWVYLLTIAPIGAVLSAAFGLTMGTRIKPQQVPLLFAVVVLPITFLGAVYYPWEALAPIKWLQISVLVNPLVYMCEGFRLSLTTGVEHMPVWAVYTAMIGFTALLIWVGIGGS